jgi:hypothetical protein
LKNFQKKFFCEKIAKKNFQILAEKVKKLKLFLALVIKEVLGRYA